MEPGPHPTPHPSGDPGENLRTPSTQHGQIFTHDRLLRCFLGSGGASQAEGRADPLASFLTLGRSLGNKQEGTPLTFPRAGSSVGNGAVLKSTGGPVLRRAYGGSLSCSFLRTLGPPVCKPCCSSPTHYAESFVQWFPKQFWGKCRCPDSSHSQFFWRRGPRNLFLNKLSKGSMTSQTWGILAQLLLFID